MFILQTDTKKLVLLLKTEFNVQSFYTIHLK